MLDDENDKVMQASPTVTPQSTQGNVIPNEGANEGANVEDEMHASTKSLEQPAENEDEKEDEHVSLRRSKRKRQLTNRMIESIEQEHMDMPINLQAIKYDNESEIFLDTQQVLSVAATTDPDTMYWDQAIKQEDATEFIQAAIEEIETHQQQAHWEVVPKSVVPSGTRVLDAIWSMKRKRNLKTNQVYKHKARLNVHGGQQQYGKDYWETYAPVVTLGVYMTTTCAHVDVRLVYDSN
jgi:hypothetical protein